jgi:hypothetical protein
VSTVAFRISENYGCMGQPILIGMLCSLEVHVMEECDRVEVVEP